MPHTTAIKISGSGKASSCLNSNTFNKFSDAAMAASFAITAEVVMPVALRNARTITPEPGTMELMNPYKKETGPIAHQIFFGFH